jgi:hypothetical protein
MDGYNIKATTACQLDRVHGISHLPKNKAFAVSVMNMTFRPLSYGRMRDAEDEDWGPWFPDENGNAFGGNWRVTPTRDTIGQVLVASH